MCRGATRRSVSGTCSFTAKGRDEGRRMMGMSVELGARVEPGTSVDSTTGAGRWLSLTGAVAAVLVVVSFAGLGGNTPTADDPAAKISAYYNAHEAREMIAAFVLAASAPFFVVFGMCLVARLRPAGRAANSTWQTLLTVGSGVAAGGFILAALIHVALVQTAGYDDIDGGALQALTGLDENSWVAFNAGLGVMMLGVGAYVLSSGAHRVLGWIALVAGIALFIPYADFFALIVSGLWLIWTSIAMYRRGPAFADAG
jgi:hypothetical protein